MKYVHLFLNEATGNKKDTCDLHSVSIELVGKSPWHLSRGRARGWVGRSATEARLSIALAWVPGSPQLPREAWGRGARSQGRRQSQETTATSLFSQKRVRAGRQGRSGRGSLAQNRSVPRLCVLFGPQAVGCFCVGRCGREAQY